MLVFPSILHRFCFLTNMIKPSHIICFSKACPPGTYKSKAIPGDVSTCTRCPDENHTTFKGSTDLGKCVCKKGYRDFNNSGCVGKVF